MAHVNVKLQMNIAEIAFLKIAEQIAFREVRNRAGREPFGGIGKLSGFPSMQQR